MKAANAIVSEGLRWAPEMWPVDRMTIITASPADPALPRSVSTPLYFWFTIGAAVAKNMRMKVPTNSDPSFRVRETSGLGKSVKHV